MSFLDNSGDIILDAVLTDLGRRRMAAGSFSITKFALGDDEINYQLYDRSHPSGSAYFDLEILQTPVLESITGIAAHINYGLLSIPNTNLLYMPILKENNQVPNSANRRDKVFYLAADDGTTHSALVSAFGGKKGGGNLLVLESGQRNGTKIIMELGLDTAEIAATAENKTNFISALGLAETSFGVSYDRRFISSVLGPGASSQFSTVAGTGKSNIRFRLNTVPSRRRNRGRRHHVMSTIRAVNNNVLKRESDTIPDTDTSVIAGPRANVTALNFTVKSLTNDDYERYGKTGQTVSGATGTYKIIDTSVRILSTKKE